MNETFSKKKIIGEAVVLTLRADNANTGNEVREIEFYCSDRIFRENIQLKRQYPLVTYKCDEGVADVGLPTSEYILTVTPWVSYSQQNAMDLLDSLTQRIISLLHKQHDNLNLIVSGKNLRCRLINKEAVVASNDDLLETYFNVITFRLICDDETINTNF